MLVREGGVVRKRRRRVFESAGGYTDLGMHPIVWLGLRLNTIM